MPSWQILPDILRQHGSEAGSIEYIEGQSDRRRVSFTETLANALGVLHHFQSAGMQRGDRVILFTPSSEQFVDGFWACQLGGLVPVPVAVGFSDDHRHKLLRIFALLDDAWVYTDEARMRRLADFGQTAGLVSEVGALLRRCFPVESIDSVATPGAECPSQPDDLALIQFSSGSTSDPKGVQLSHANLLTNIVDISTRCELIDEDRMLSWMPLTHDMGLIGMYLSAVAMGVSGAIMDTRLFTRRPLLWLEEAHRLGASVLSSPNFGYKHVLKVLRNKGLGRIRLDRVRLIFNGAEPILPGVCREFLDAMAPYGLRPESMYPVYGLAEASLAVTIPSPGRNFPTLHVNRRRLSVGDTIEQFGSEHPDAMELVGCGKPLDQCECRIADDGNQPSPEGYVGRIQIRGANVTRGYLDRDAGIEQPFTPDGWLDTGDLGFFHDGDLYVCGRAKEILFVNGENYYPNDLEALAAQQSMVELGKVAIAAVREPGVQDDREQIIAFLLHRGSAEEFVDLARELRRTLVEQTGVELDRCVPVRNIPKTTSGKLQRRKLAAAYLDGEFAAEIEAVDAVLAEAVGPIDESVNDIEQQLLDICAEVIVDRRVGVDDDLFDLGVNSLALVEIHERLEERFPGRVEVEDLFERPSVRALAAWLVEERTGD